MNTKNNLRILMFLFTLTFVTSCNTKLSNELEDPFNQGKTSTDLRSLDDEGFYSISESIMHDFQHYCQRKAGKTQLPNYPNGENAIPDSLAKSSCALTSYMMVAHALTARESEQVPLSGNELGNLINQVGIAKGAYKSLSNIKDKLANGKLNGSRFLKFELLGTTDRSKIKKFIKKAINNNMFVLVALKADVSSKNAYDKLNNDKYGNFLSPSEHSNPDMLYETSKNQYLLTTATPKTPYHNGHIVIVTEIDIWDTGNGTVGYIDPLAKTRGTGTHSENTRISLYSRLLDAMKVNGANNTYTALAIGKK